MLNKYLYNQLEYKHMTRLIAVASGKGGVGKTTTVVNLGAALTNLNKNIIVLDANLTTPDMGSHLGMMPEVSLNDVLEGNADLVDAVSMHSSGLRVLLAGVHLKHLRTTNPSRLWDIVFDLFGSADAVILDTPAGLEKGAKAVLDAGEEVIIVTNPDIPAVKNAARTVQIAYESGAHVLGAVLNKTRKEPGEIKPEHIEAVLGIPVLSTIPHDDEVRNSIRLQSPIVLRKPNSPAARAYKQLAADLMGIELKLPPKDGLFRKALKNIFGIE